MIQIKDNDTGQRKQRSQDTTFSRNKLFSTKKRAMHKALVACLLDVDAMASQAQRRAAFDNAGLDAPLSTLIDKVAMQAYKVTDDDIAAVKASGLSEDQIYELVVCAAVGQATRQYDTALAALAEATAGKGSCEHAS
jgi:alkylhydroperoxidase family enzyme